jgi:hypothetical protein
MKKIKLLLLAFLLSAFNCSPDEVEECGCYKVITDFEELELSRSKVDMIECKDLVPGQPYYYFVHVPLQSIYRFDLVCQ